MGRDDVIRNIGQSKKGDQVVVCTRLAPCGPDEKKGGENEQDKGDNYVTYVRNVRKTTAVTNIYGASAVSLFF